jgi:hypothetical protein
MVIENAEAFRARLRKSGQMDAFQVLKNQYIADGMPKKQAWEQAAAAFPPPESDCEPESEPRSQPGKVTLKQFEGKSNSFVNDIAWVYSHLRIDDVTPDMAPSTGAWSMLLWARRLENTTKFMQIAQKHLPSVRDKLGHPAPGEQPAYKSVLDGLDLTGWPISKNTEDSGQNSGGSPTGKEGADGNPDSESVESFGQANRSSAEDADAENYPTPTDTVIDRSPLAHKGAWPYKRPGRR